MKKKYYLKICLLTFGLAFSFTLHSQIISQYIETNSGTTPKGIEIWNNTGSTLDFSTNNLVIEKGTNGAAPSTDATISTGTLAPGAVMVIGTSDMGTYLTDQGRSSVFYTLKGFTFNGDDALVVKYGGTTTDVFGDPGTDPGSAWTGSGVETRNQNIRLIDDSDGAGTGLTSGDTDGWTDPSTRFVTVNTTPSTLPAGLEGFGLAPITTTWDGSDSTDWSLAANWSNGIPTTSSNIDIPSGMPNEPNITTGTGAVGNDITIDGSATLTISSGASIIITGISTGNFSYSRTLTTNWHLVSSPVGSQDINTFTVTDVATNAIATSGTNYGVAPYDNNGSAWDYYTTSTIAGAGNFTAGKGYSALRASAGDVTFTGTFPTSDVSIAITDGSSNEWNLIGNPYPSYIPANSGADATNNFITINTADLNASFQAVYFWDGSSYVAINHASSSRFIAPGQGFFVNSIASGSTIDFTEAMQSHQTDVFSKTKSTKPEISLQMTDGVTNKSTEITYIAGTTKGLDPGYDAGMFTGVANTFSIYTHLVTQSDGTDFSLQSLPTNDYENIVIPIGVNATSGKEISFSVNAMNLPTNIKIYLEDKNDGSFTRLDEVNTQYTITLNNNLSGIGRFYLHTKSSVLNVPNFNSSSISMYKTSTFNLRVVGLQNGNASIHIYNVLGKRVHKTSFKAKAVNNINLPSLKTGIYIIQLTTEQGEISKKILID